jgi:NAD(P)-dependent dehydrogenase (short-subunit alcohol dehydrogenase family)
MSDFLNLRDHVIVITGAASGMGQAIAHAASREGARLVLADVDGARLKATAAEVSGDVRQQPADVTRLPRSRRSSSSPSVSSVASTGS